LNITKRIKCKLCNSLTITYEWSDFTLLQCKNCLLVSDHKIYDTKELNTLYDVLYHHSDNYDNYNREYEQLLNEIQPKLGWNRKKALQISQLKDHNKVIEFGAGVGVFGKYLLNRQVDYLGVEFDRSIVDKTETILGNSIVQGDIQNFLNNQKYDILFAFEVIEHISNLKKAFQNISKLLYPNGIFCFSVPNILRSNNNNNKISQDKPPIHLNYFSKSSIIKILGNYNFNNIKVFERPYPMLSSPMKHWIKLFFGSYNGMSLVVKATRTNYRIT